MVLDVEGSIPFSRPTLTAGYGYEIATGLPGEHGAFDLRDVKPGSCGVCIRRGLLPTLERLVPGEYTVCVMPLAGSPRDQQIKQQVYSDRASMKVYSTPVRVVAAPAEQTMTVQLPR